MITVAEPLDQLFRLSEVQRKALKKLQLKTAGDLLRHFPTRYGDTATIKNIDSLANGDEVVLFGKISQLKTAKAFHKKIAFAEAKLTDETGQLKLVWFNQPYIAKLIKDNSTVRVEGKVLDRKSELYLSNPKIEMVSKLPLGVGDSLFGQDGEKHALYPIYPESRGLTSNWFYHAIQKIFKTGLLEKLTDPIPSEILQQYHLPSLTTALIWIHGPQKTADALAARKRFAFEEVFLIQLERQQEKRAYREHHSFTIKKTEAELADFIGRFPFTPTQAQTNTIKQILTDLASQAPMSRLLEGDVGSGKTAVAAAITYAVTTTRPLGQNYGTLQTAYMAPTEILAKQHFENFIKFFSYLNINIGLITSSGCYKFPSKIKPTEATNISRAQLLKWVANGEIPILVGTHALIQKSIQFKNLAFIIIDEQHRFGVRQRQALARGKIPDPTPTNAETEEESLLYRDLSYVIRGAIFEVKKNIGLGHKEVVYQRALEEELLARKIPYNKEKQIPILYRNKKIGVYRPDFVIDDKVIVELKAIPFLGNNEKKQIWTYLKGSDYKLALLVNFAPTKIQIERIVYDTARVSASSSRQSASLPHLLSMTATPIPRTLALTIYGDLDLSVLDEMPVGRKPIITEIVSPAKRNQTYEKIRAELKSGRQLYVICPRIDEPDPDKELSLIAKSVKAEAKRLKKEVFPEYEIGVLHSKLKPKDKDQVMADFADNKYQILCATSVVEVGVNVSNATMIIIEGAERFGLAQLHQLRGRVIRSNYQAYCFVFTDSQGDKTVERLKALKTAKNGFELAEYDLQQRGGGTLSGQKQWGITDLGMEAIKNLKMVEAARTEATKLIKADPELTKKEHQPLKDALSARNHQIHFE